MSEFVKPTIPAEVADAIEYYRGLGTDNASIVAYRTCLTAPAQASALRDVPFDTFLAALVNGYERELTEEEQAYAEIRKEYRNARLAGYDGDEQADGFVEGVDFTLRTLGIRIEGVSA